MLSLPTGQCGCYFKGLEELPFMLLMLRSRDAEALNMPFEKDNHEWLSGSNMTWLVEHIRNLPFVQGLLHGSSLQRALQASPSSGCGEAPLGQINSHFTAEKQHGPSSECDWLLIPALQMIRNLGLNHLHYKFWQILERLSVWIQGWQHHLLLQKKNGHDKWVLQETVEADIYIKM